MVSSRVPLGRLWLISSIILWVSREITRSLAWLWRVTDTPISVWLLTLNRLRRSSGPSSTRAMSPRRMTLGGPDCADWVWAATVGVWELALRAELAAAASGGADAALDDFAGVIGRAANCAG